MSQALSCSNFARFWVLLCRINFFWLNRHEWTTLLLRAYRLPAHYKLVVKFLWFHGRAAMMAFRITRSTCKVSKLFYCICDWVRVNKNNGNVLKTAKNRLVPVSDGPRHGKVVLTSVLCWPCRVFCAVNKYVQAFI